MSKPRKRANGEGTVIDLPDGRKRAVWTAGKHADGRLIRHSVTAATKREALALMRDRQQEERLGHPVTNSQETVEQYLVRWLADRIRGTVRESTMSRYTTLLRSTYAHIGHLRLCDLHPAHLQAMYQQLSADYAPATLSRLRAVLHHAFEGAVEWDLLTKNPATYAHPPKVEKRERPALSVAEARHLFDVTKEDRWGPLWVILATCGLRINEALSLRWTDVTSDAIIIPGGKTEAAARTVPLTAVAVEALERRKREWRADMMRHRDIWPRPDPNLVFSTELGKRQYHETTWRLFQHALEAADLPRMRQHDLRRTAVAWMREAGVDADVVQVLIGHRNISTTLDLYGSINKRRIEDAGRLLNHYLEDAR